MSSRGVVHRWVMMVSTSILQTVFRSSVEKNRHDSPLPPRFMDQGKFVPDGIILEILVAAVDQVKDQGKHIMLDGFPRCLQRPGVWSPYPFFFQLLRRVGALLISVELH